MYLNKYLSWRVISVTEHTYNPRRAPAQVKETETKIPPAYKYDSERHLAHTTKQYISGQPCGANRHD